MKEISEALGSALIAYLEGEATLLQIESLHEWAGLDPENAELLYGLKHLYAERNATSKLEAVDVETMRHRLLARPEFASEERIAALRPAPRRKLWRKIWFRAVGYAASAAALIAVGVLVGKSGGTVFSDSFNTICVDAGSKSRIVLADGTQVTMKASSKLRYPASFGSGPREVARRRSLFRCRTRCGASFHRSFVPPVGARARDDFQCPGLFQRIREHRNASERSRGARLAQP